jgi:hypothetical protein
MPTHTFKNLFFILSKQNQPSRPVTLTPNQRHAHAMISLSHSHMIGVSRSRTITVLEPWFLSINAATAVTRKYSMENNPFP